MRVLSPCSYHCAQLDLPVLQAVENLKSAVRHKKLRYLLTSCDIALLAIYLGGRQQARLRLRAVQDKNYKSDLEITRDEFPTRCKAASEAKQGGVD